MSASAEFSVRAAARELGVTLSHAYALIWAGRLQARQVGGRWKIPRAAVEERLRRRRKRQSWPGPGRSSGKK